MSSRISQLKALFETSCNNDDNNNNNGKSHAGTSSVGFPLRKTRSSESVLSDQNKKDGPAVDLRLILNAASSPPLTKDPKARKPKTAPLFFSSPPQTARPHTVLVLPPSPLAFSSPLSHNSPLDACNPTSSDCERINSAAQNLAASNRISAALNRVSSPNLHNDASRFDSRQFARENITINGENRQATRHDSETNDDNDSTNIHDEKDGDDDEKNIYVNIHTSPLENCEKEKANGRSTSYASSDENIYVNGLVSPAEKAFATPRRPVSASDSTSDTVSARGFHFFTPSETKEILSNQKTCVSDYLLPSSFVSPPRKPEEIRSSVDGNDRRKREDEKNDGNARNQSNVNNNHDDRNYGNKENDNGVDSSSSSSSEESWRSDSLPFASSNFGQPQACSTIGRSKPQAFGPSQPTVLNASSSNRQSLASLTIGRASVSFLLSDGTSTATSGSGHDSEAPSSEADWRSAMDGQVTVNEDSVFAPPKSDETPSTMRTSLGENANETKQIGNNNIGNINIGNNDNSRNKNHNDSNINNNKILNRISFFEANDEKAGKKPALRSDSLPLHLSPIPQKYSNPPPMNSTTTARLTPKEIAETDSAVLRNRDKASPRPASMFPALGSLAPLREEETPAEIGEDGFVLVATPSSTMNPSKLVASASTASGGTSDASAGRLLLTSKLSLRGFDEDSEESEVAPHRRKSFLHGRRDAEVTAAIASRGNLKGASSYPLLGSAASEGRPPNGDKRHYQNIDNADSGSSRRDYVQLDPDLVKRFEKLSENSKSGCSSPYYSQPPPRNDDDNENDDDNNNGNQTRGQDFEVAAEALGDDESSYDRLLHFTRRQFVESKDELRRVMIESPEAAGRTPEEPLGNPIEGPAHPAAKTTPSSKKKVGFQFRGPAVTSPPPPPVPPHQTGNPSGMMTVISSGMSMAAAAVVVTTPYASPEAFQQQCRSDEDIRMEGDIPPYAVGYATGASDDEARSLSGEANPEVTHNLRLLPGEKLRSSSEPSIFSDQALARLRSNTEADAKPHLRRERPPLTKTSSSPIQCGANVKAQQPSSPSQRTTTSTLSPLPPQRKESQGLSPGSVLLNDEASLTKDQLGRIRQGFFKVTESVKPLDSELGFSPKPPIHDGISSQTSDEEETYKLNHERKLRYVNSKKDLRDKTRKNFLKKKSESLFNFVLLVKIGVRGTIRRDIDEERESQTIKPFIAQKFPEDTGADLLTISQFCFPETTGYQPIWDADCDTYLFVLTSEDSTRQYGYCRRFLPPSKGPTKPVVYCLVSSVFAFGLYDRILTELEHYVEVSETAAWKFLMNAYETNLPTQVGKPTSIKTPLPETFQNLEVHKPRDRAMESVDVSILLEMLGPDNVIVLFSTILLERSVILVSRQLTELSRCILALVALLYPFNWEHTLIPILPSHLLEICSTPFPYIVGVQESSLEGLSLLEIDDVLVVNLDEGRIIREMGDEATILPPKLHRCLLRGLQYCYEENSSAPSSSSSSGLSYCDLLLETFLCFFVSTCGHYLEYVNDVSANNNNNKSFGTKTFNKAEFCNATFSESLKMFLMWFSETQMFELFIAGRLELGQSRRGDFERKIFEYQEDFAAYSKQTGAQLRLKVKNFGQMFKQVFK